MVIHLYTLCYNAEKMLPYFLEHYDSICDRIFVYDNLSTDRTAEIVRGCAKAELRVFDTDGKIDEFKYLHIKNFAYQESRGVADYVIVVDVDEFLYHPDIQNLLKDYLSKGITLPKIKGYNMVSLFYPKKSWGLVNQVTRGRFSPQYSKRCIFSPNIDINYMPGAHQCKPQGLVIESDYAEIKLLHYHYIGLLTVMARYRDYAARLSDLNRRYKYAVQYSRSDLYIFARFIKNWVLARKVIF